jgi:hypothetical protein
MKQRFGQGSLRIKFRTIVAGFILLAVGVAIPLQFRTQAYVGDNANIVGGNVTVSHVAGLEFYDIRLDKSDEAQQARSQFRQKMGHDLADASRAQADIRSAEQELSRRVADLQVDYNQELNIAHVVGTDVLKSGAFLTEAGGKSREGRESLVRGFLYQNKALYGLTAEQVSELRTFANYTNPAGNLSFVEMAQEVNGIPVFMGEIRAVIARNGELARTINNLVPGLDYQAMEKTPGHPKDAIIAAAKAINRQATDADLQLKTSASDGQKLTFERGQFDGETTAELVYFPIEPGVATLAWRVLLWEPVAAYYVMVDATNGRLLWRQNITADQSESATYTIYNRQNPAPLSPSTATPGSGIQGAGIPRVTVTFIGNEGPLNFNNNGWITNGGNTTTGNNVDAGLDRVTPNGIDPTGRPTGSPNRVFTFAYNPPPLGTDDPLTVPHQNGAVTNLFYWNNVYHDVLYQLGFTEQARNFQLDNFGRGGVANDRVMAEAQDFSGTNNANMSPTSDGQAPRMQMYLWSAPTPDRDGDLDAEIIIHEYTHGLSGRTHANGSGLTSAQGGGMGEGWGDFFGRSVTSNASEDVNGLYSTGSYSTLQFNGEGTDNYYYGIRRFPYAVRSNTGGPMNRPHSPLTYADVDPAQENVTDGAYAKNPAIANGTGVHNMGENWCNMLLEVRARMITRLGYAVGNQRMMQLVVDGMKLDPTGAALTMVSARNAIIAADQAGFAGADTGDIWAGFAARGCGFGASTNGTAVVESFLLPNLQQGPTFSFSDSPGNNNGFAEPGESLILTVPVQNPLSDPAIGVTVSVNGGPAVSYGDIAGGATETRTINYTVPAGTACGSMLTLTFNINSSLGPTSTNRQIRVGIPTTGGSSQDFDGVTAPALPNLWETTNSGGQLAWVTSTVTPSSAPNAAFGNDGTTTGESTLVTPDVVITSAAASVTFKRNNAFETPDWDGMVLEISVNGGAFQDIVAAGGAFTAGAYNGTIRTATPNPLSGRAGWIGTTAGAYVDTTATLPASTNGQTIKLRLRIGTDSSTGGAGARIDNINFTGGAYVNGFACPPLPPTEKPVADFDGDGKTDLSVFRSGTWHLLRSTAGPLSQPFGLASDRIVPGDYDGDAKADIAVFRTNTWYILRSSDGVVSTVPWGTSGDIPMTGDYDGDGKADTAVYRPSNNTFYVLRSSNGTVGAQGWGIAGDVPVAGDFDGDGTTDYAVFRSGTWHVLGSTAGYSATPFGLAGDKLTPGDFDGDGKTDHAVFRSGTWYLRQSTAGLATIPYGVASDTAAPGDYDGDGKSDVAVFRSSTGTWYVLRSSNGLTDTTAFGTSGDQAVPAGYLP